MRYVFDFDPFSLLPAQGIVPASGEFVYDEARPEFTYFHVLWNGITFDFTGTANSGTWPPTVDQPLPLTCALSGAALTFTFLTTDECSIGWIPGLHWRAHVGPAIQGFDSDLGIFSFYRMYFTDGFYFVNFERTLDGLNGYSGHGEGRAVIAAILPVAEPPIASLLLAGLLGALARRRPARPRLLPV